MRDETQITRNLTVNSKLKKQENSTLFILYREIGSIKTIAPKIYAYDLRYQNIFIYLSFINLNNFHQSLSSLDDYFLRIKFFKYARFLSIFTI